MEPASASFAFGAPVGSESKRSTGESCDACCNDVAAASGSCGITVPVPCASPFSGSQPPEFCWGGLYGAAIVGFAAVVCVGTTGIIGGSVASAVWSPVSNSTPSVGTSVIPKMAHPKQHSMIPACQ